MALPLLEVGTDLVVRNLKSIPYAQMTLDTLAEFGIKITHQNFEKFKIEGNQQYRGVKYAVESDWSSASYWLVAAALGHQIKCVGLSQNSHQADRYILDALVKANCVVMTDETGISVNGNGRRSFEFDATHLTNENFNLIQTLPEIIKESGEIGEFELDILKITINHIDYMT